MFAFFLLQIQRKRLEPIVHCIDECGGGASAQRFNTLHHVHNIRFIADALTRRCARMHGATAEGRNATKFQSNANDTSYIQSIVELQQVLLCTTHV